MPQTLQKAKLIDLTPGSSKVVPVQFNPQNLKLNFSNQWKSPNEKQGQSTQFVGTSKTKLSMDLWFDVSLPLTPGTDDPHGDVRNITKNVVYFMIVQALRTDPPAKQVPPKVRFEWGSFRFEGTMESVDETVDMFSPDGVPQRASLAVVLVRHDLIVEPQKIGGLQDIAGTVAMLFSKVGDSIQQIAATAGFADWQSLARANNVSNPRQLPPGSAINLSGNGF